MAKVAKLIVASPMVRVVVDKTASYDEILEAARPKLIEAMRTELGSHIEEVRNDTECPHLEFRHIALDTPKGRIEGLFSEQRLNVEAIPVGLVPYFIRRSDEDDSVPATIETHVTVNFFGMLVVAEPLDFSGTDHIEILDWGFDEESDTTPECLKKHLSDE